MKRENDEGFVEEFKHSAEETLRAIAEEYGVSGSGFEKITEEARAEGIAPGIIEESERDFVHNAARNSIQRALAIGGGLKEAARGTLTGIVRGNQDTGQNALIKIALTGDAMIWNANDLHADLGEIAQGVVEAAIEVARDAAVEPEIAAKAAATTVLATARRIGGDAVQKVKPWTSTRVLGVRVEAHPLAHGS